MQPVLWLALLGARTLVRPHCTPVARSRVVMAAPRGRGPPPPEHMINDHIKASEVRVVVEPEDPSQPDEPVRAARRAA